MPHTNASLAPNALPGRTAPLRIAIVEDEPLVARLMQDMLATSKVEVTVFMQGADLLNCPGLMDFASIVMDLSLPGLDGFDLLGKLSALQHKARILMVSGQSRTVLQASHLYGRGMGLNVTGLLCKPFSRDELLIALNLLQ